MIQARQQQKIQHGHADQELFLCPSPAAKMVPGHAVPHLGIGEQRVLREHRARQDD